jgi:hypothetical protein
VAEEEGRCSGDREGSEGALAAGTSPAKGEEWGWTRKKEEGKKRKKKRLAY